MKIVKLNLFKIDSADGNTMSASLPSFNLVLIRRKPNELGAEAKACIELLINNTNENQSRSEALGLFGIIGSYSDLKLYFEPEGNVLHTYSTALSVKGGGLGGWDVSVKELYESFNGTSDELFKYVENHLSLVFSTVWRHDINALTSFIIQNVYKQFVDK